MQRNGLEVTDEMEEAMCEHEEKGHTAVLVGVNGESLILLQKYDGNLMKSYHFMYLNSKLQEYLVIFFSALLSLVMEYQLRNCEHAYAFDPLRWLGNRVHCRVIPFRQTLCQSLSVFSGWDDASVCKSFDLALLFS